MSYKLNEIERDSVGQIGFTCGAFDLLHAGHALMLKECKEQCDYLVVGLQRDPSVDRPDSKNAPIQEYSEREVMLSSIRYVDEVAYYDTEADLVQLLQDLAPDVRIIGADWQGKQFTGYELVTRVYFNSRDHGYSTSSLRERVYQREYKKRVTLDEQIRRNMTNL